MSFDRADREILLALLKNEHFTQRGLQRDTKLSPRILERHLKALEERKYVVQSARGSRYLGYDYALTMKGKRAASKTAWEKLGETFRVFWEAFDNVEVIFREFTSEPSAAAMMTYRETLRKLDPSIKVTGPYGGEFPISEDGPFEKQRIMQRFEELKNAFLAFQAELTLFSAGPLQSHNSS